MGKLLFRNIPTEEFNSDIGLNGRVSNPTLSRDTKTVKKDGIDIEAENNNIPEDEHVSHRNEKSSSHYSTECSFKEQYEIASKSEPHAPAMELISSNSTSQGNCDSALRTIQEEKKQTSETHEEKIPFINNEKHEKN